MKKFILLSVSGFTLFLCLNGCSFGTEHVVYREVFVPTKCDAPHRIRPIRTDSIAKYFSDILIYTELLEKDLSYCRGEEND